MKKVLSLLLVVCMCIGLIGCEDPAITKRKEELVNQVEEKKMQSTEMPIETEEDDSFEKNLKTEAVETNFVEISQGNWEGKTVKATGEINAVDNKANIILLDSFCISAREGGGYGAYFCKNVTDREDLKDGDVVTIYGVVDEEENPYGLDSISVYIIE